MSIESAGPGAAGAQGDEDLLHDAIRQLRQHSSTIQAAKKASASGEAQGMAPIWNLINALPGIIRQLDSAEFDRDASFEEYEDRATPARLDTGDVEALRAAVSQEVKIWADTRWPKSCRVGSKGWVNGLTNRILAALSTTDVGVGSTQPLTRTDIDGVMP